MCIITIAKYEKSRMYFRNKNFSQNKVDFFIKQLHLIKTQV